MGNNAHNQHSNDPLSLFLSSDNDSFVPPPDGDVPDHINSALKDATTAGATSASLVDSTSTIPGVDTHWDGLTFLQSGGYYPPDNALAAGSSVVIAAENDAIQFTSLTGTGALTESLEKFFAPVLSSGYFLTDPRVLYDTANHRFIVAVDEVSNNLTSSKILLAVSKTDLSAPSLSSANWTFEAASTTYKINGITTWADQPLVSVDGQDIYVSTNQFSARSGAYIGDAVSVFNHGLYNGTASSLVSATAYADSSYQPAAIAGGGEYWASYTYNGLSIFKSTPTSSGVVNSTPLHVSLGTIDYGSGAYAASEAGTSFQLDAGDGRITSAAYDSANQKLYVVFEVQPTSTSTTPSVEWVQLDMSGFNASHGTVAPTVLHEGNLNSLLPTTGATTGAATFNGSVAVDANGDVLFNFNVSGPNMLPADYFTVWKGAGSATSATVPSFATPTDYHDSQAAYIDPAKDPVSRWGDYSTAIADPNHANGFYISNEFDNGSVTVAQHTYSSWGTASAHLLV